MRVAIPSGPVPPVIRLLAAALVCVAPLILRAAESAPPPVPTIAWRARADAPIRADAALDGDRVFFASSDGALRAVDRRDGHELWRRAVDESLDATPAVGGGLVFAIGRAGGLYAFDARDGHPVWKRPFGAALTPTLGWDHTLAAPVVADRRVYAAGSDGTLRAFELTSGRPLWRFAIPARIRSTPAVAGQRIVFGGADGVVYCVDLDGKPRWTFRTEGADIDLVKAGFDRRTITARPLVVGDEVVLGSRDGHVYAIALADGAKRWSWSGGVYWIVGGAAATRDLIVFGSSDGRYVQALDARTGAERWRTPVDGNALGNVAIRGDRVYATTLANSSYDVDLATNESRMRGRWSANGGSLYALDATTGHIEARLPLGAPTTAGVVADDAHLYIGAEDGFLYAVDTAKANAAAAPTERAVFFSKTPGWTWFKNDSVVREFFEAAGYARLDDAGLVAFLERHSTSDAPSVVVLATDILPDAALATSASPLRRYLDAGGKVVSIGALPGTWKVEAGHDQPTGSDFRGALVRLGISIDAKTTIEADEQAPLRVTSEGARWGLRDAFVGTAALPRESVDAMLVESGEGRALAWVKTFGTHRDRGFVRLWGRMDGLPNLDDVLRAAELGLP